MNLSFGSRDLTRCLLKLGFTPNPQVGSRHLKFISPRPVSKGQRSFIIVLQNKKVYDPITCKNIFRQIKQLGFSEEEILKCLH